MATTTEQSQKAEANLTVGGFFGYLLLGTIFGIIFVQSEVVSWFRIQEMFRFEAFHMYGIIGSAVVVAMIGVQAIKYFDIRTLDGEKIHINPKQWTNYR